VVAAVDADVSRQTERPLPRDETAPVAADEWQPARPRRRTLERHARRRKIQREVARAAGDAESFVDAIAALQRDGPDLARDVDPWRRVVRGGRLGPEH